MTINKDLRISSRCIQEYSVKKSAKNIVSDGRQSHQLSFRSSNVVLYSRCFGSESEVKMSIHSVFGSGRKIVKGNVESLSLSRGFYFKKS